MKDILSREEKKRILKAFLKHPNRLDTGATSDDMIKVVRWVEELKLNMLLNKTILKEIYTGYVVLDLNEQGEVVMSGNPNPPEQEIEVDHFLVGDLDDYLEDNDGN